MVASDLWQSAGLRGWLRREVALVWAPGVKTISLAVRGPYLSLPTWGHTFNVSVRRVPISSSHVTPKSLRMQGYYVSGYLQASFLPLFFSKNLLSFLSFSAGDTTFWVAGKATPVNITCMSVGYFMSFLTYDTTSLSSRYSEFS